MRTLAILTAAFLVPGCFAEPPPRGDDRQPVINGDPASDPAVVALMDGAWFFCTGTVISPRVVLTAAHCLEYGAPTSIFFGADANVPGSGTLVGVGAYLMHPDYPQRADIGVVELAEPAGVTPSALNRTPLSASLAGQDVRVVGFGLSEDGGEAAGVKLAGVVTFDSVEADYMLVQPKGGQSGCYGDSGGPNYMQLGGAEVVAGVTSFGTEDSCLAGLGGNTDVEQYAAWVDEFVEMIDGAAPVPGCGADGTCVAECVTPDPDCPVDPGPDPGEDPGDDDNTDGDNGGGATAGCRAGGGAGGGAGWLAIVLLVGLGRDRARARARARARG